MTKVTRIGFDLDRVFIGYPPIVPQRLIDWLYKHSLQELVSLKIHSDDTTYYRFPTSKTEQLIRQISHNFLLRPRLQTNINFVKSLQQDPQLEIYLISSRYKFLEKITLNILKKYQLFTVFKKIFLNTQNQQPHLFKEKVICDLELDLFIDDDLKLLKYLKPKCNDTRFIWYNPMHYSQQHDGITMIHDLREVQKHL